MIQTRAKDRSVVRNLGNIVPCLAVILVATSGCAPQEESARPTQDAEQAEQRPTPAMSPVVPPTLDQMRQDTQGLWVQTKEFLRDEVLFGPNNRALYSLFISRAGTVSYLEYVVLYEHGNPSDVSFIFRPIARVDAVSGFKGMLALEPDQEWRSALQLRHPGAEFRFTCGAFETRNPETREYPALYVFTNRKAASNPADTWIEGDPLMFRRTSFENLRSWILSQAGGGS